MERRKLIALVLLCGFLSASNATAELNFVYGEEDELRGAKSIYVDTGSEADLRKIINGIIKKRLPGVDLKNKGAEGVLSLFFSYEPGRAEYFGEIAVVMDAGDERRLLATLRHHEAELDDLADEIAKQFVKLYLKYNPR